MFTLICAQINGWVNTPEAGDLRRYRPHYDVIVMILQDAKHLSHSVNAIAADGLTAHGTMTSPTTSLTLFTKNIVD